MREEQRDGDKLWVGCDRAGISLADNQIIRNIIIIPSAGTARRDLASIR